MNRFIAVLALAALMSCASAATVHDVMPKPESMNIWGLMPYNDVEVHAGTKVIFRVPKGYHDIALVTNHTEMDACDMTNARVVVDTEGVIQPDFVNDGNSVTEEGSFYVFTWTVTEAKDYYIVCTVQNGKHCRAGQKFELEVEDEAGASPDVTVTGAPVPFWTVGVEYPDMTIELGDSLRFVSDNQGFHDIVLLKETCGKSTNFDCCGTMDIPKFIHDHEAMELYEEADFEMNPEFIWTPDQLGVHDIICGEGQHCLHGQKFTLTVVEPKSEALSPPDSGAAATSLLASTLAALAAFLAMAY